MPQSKRRRALRPLDALILTRERIQEVLDDAVDRGRMTRADAADLLAELVRRGRRQTDDLMGTARRAATASLRSSPLEAAGAASSRGSSFPIPGYDDLTAAQVTERLDGLGAAELRTIRDHERRNANRKSVLAAIERELP